ncbi:MAG: alanine dehydrogenase [Pseudomonadota bacterium]|nr:alanine dehydrogenase [Pseudomonadota bacterium]
MKIGVPKEIKTLEGRVGLIPAACADLIKQGNELWVQSGAGLLSGYSDEDYTAQGARIAADAAALYCEAQLIVKVKEPLAGDLQHLQKHHLLFCYLHLAANAALAKQLCQIGLTAVAFETVTDHRGRLPLLAPMSDIAGRLSVQIGTHLLHSPQGGRGLMLGGMALADRGRVVVLGVGRAGGAAARLASDLGARVTVFDKNPLRLEELHNYSPNIAALYAYHHTIAEAVSKADLLIGAVLLPGLHAPRIVTEAMVKTMQTGSVIMDISVDQGGCVETIHATDYANPTYVQHGVVHFGVTNMPGAVPRTSSQALSAVITPYVQRLATPGWALEKDLQNGINIRDGKIDNPLIEQALA